MDGWKGCIKTVGVKEVRYLILFSQEAKVGKH